MTGMVYVISNGSLIKIGKAKDVSSRIATLERSGGFKCANVWVSKQLKNPLGFERACHKRLDEKRTLGEWFDIDFFSAVQAVKDELEKFTDENNIKPVNTDGLKGLVKQVAINENLSSGDYKRELEEAIELSLGAGCDDILGLLQDNAGELSLCNIYMIQSVCAKIMLKDAMELMQMKGVI